MLVPISVFLLGDKRYSHLRFSKNGVPHTLAALLFGTPARSTTKGIDPRPPGLDDYATLAKMRFPEKPKPARLDLLRRDRSRAPFLCHHI